LDFFRLLDFFLRFGGVLSELDEEELRERFRFDLR
jgi:hypothetical protein